MQRGGCEGGEEEEGTAAMMKRELEARDKRLMFEGRKPGND